MKNNKRKPKHGKKSTLTKGKKIGLAIISIIVCILLIGGIYIYSELGKMSENKISQDNESLGIDTTVDSTLNKKDITNIALFGVDSRDENSDAGSRSDSIMVLSIDKEHNKIKIASIMRDTYVSVDDYGMTKITHAYAYGGPELAIKTINKNFDMNIKDYATVDFFGLEKIIDAIGGVDIDVQQEEIDIMNKYIKETSGIESKTPKYVTQYGPQALTGMQAVAYSRIRYVGNGDFERTERQRTVLNGLFDKVTNAGITTYPGLLNEVLPFLETSLSKTDILALGTSVLTNGITDMEQLRLPEDGFCQGQTIDGVYYLVGDLDVATNDLYEFIYEEDKK